MALGYCEKCGELTPIVPLRTKPGSREREWFPQPHAGCKGHLFEIKNHPEKPRAPRAD